MLIKDSVVTLGWTLSKNASFATHVEAYFDIQITDPDGIVTYQEGSTPWATSFVQPGDVDAADGSLTYDYTFLKTGVYTIILSTGAAASFTVLDTVLALVVSQDAAVNNIVNLS